MARLVDRCRPALLVVLSFSAATSSQYCYSSGFGISRGVTWSTRCASRGLRKSCNARYTVFGDRAYTGSETMSTNAVRDAFNSSVSQMRKLVNGAQSRNAGENTRK